MTPQRIRLLWKELWIGIVVITGFVVLAFAIFYITSESGFFEPQYTVIAYFANANGLRKGAEVWFEGIQVGSVDSVDVSKQLDDPLKTIQVSMKIYRRFQDMIRTDSKVVIETQGVLGNNIVAIYRGTAAGQVVPDGGTLQGEPTGDVKRIINGTNDFVANLDSLSAQIQRMRDRLHSGEGSLGKLMVDQEIRNNLDNTVEEAVQLVQDAVSGNGSIGLNTNAPLWGKAYGVLARINNMADYVESGHGTLGRIPSLAERGDVLAARFHDIADNIGKGKGSFGKLMTSENLFQPTMQKVNDLANSIKNGQGGKFIKDPTFRDTMSQIASEYLKLFYDFSKNPEKYLKINFKFF